MQFVDLLVQIRVQVATARVIVRVSPIVERCDVSVFVDFGVALEVRPRELVGFPLDRFGRGLAGRVQALAGHLDLVQVFPGVVLDDDALQVI